MKRIINKRKQAGMTLTESLLVLGVAAMVAVLAYGGYKMATSSVSTSSQVNGTIQLVGGIKRIFGTGADYSTVNVANVINSQIVPADFKKSGTTDIYNGWGGNITPAVGDQAGATPTSVFKLTIAGVPVANCIELVAGIASAAQSLWVGGTTAGTHDVKPATGSFMPDRAATQCAALGTGNIILVAQ